MVMRTNFRNLSEYPTGHELSSSPTNLRAILKKGSYENAEDYLDTNFRLFREDFMDPLRRGIRKYETRSDRTVLDGIILYPRTTIECIRVLKSQRLGFLVKFHQNTQTSRTDWKNSKRLMFGNLLIFTSDKFRTFFYGLVLQRDDEELEKGQIVVEIPFFGHLVQDQSYRQYPKVEYLMAESEAFFEPYHKIMVKLQTLNENNFPMLKYIVYSGSLGERQLLAHNGYLGDRMPTYLNYGTQEWNVLGYSVDLRWNQLWPSASQLGMNVSQYEAFKEALTSDFCLIQGPPGTGKTFVGLKIVEALLRNVPRVNMPILIVCQTNQALDQFLEGISKLTKKLIRVGSGSNSKILKPFTLRGGTCAEKLTIEKKKWIRTSDGILMRTLSKDMASRGVKLNMKPLQDVYIDRIHDYLRLSESLEACKQYVDASVLKEMKVIGMTTSCAARMQQELNLVKPSIVIVEEAAEVLEAHIVASLTGNCQQLILIGDHKQLSPMVSTQLAKDYHLDVSMFERLINNEMRCSTLLIQHRMRPEISKLLRHIYPNLKDDPSVHEYAPVRGVRKNVFCLKHQNSEKEVRKSFRNPFEVNFILSLCRYLLNYQGYSPAQITILTPYLSQVELFLEVRETYLHSCVGIQDVECCTVDKYQGEENDIILLSLVRSNSTGGIGFLGIENRVNVALSRAKQGLYIVGNMDFISRRNLLWKKIRKTLEKHAEIGDRMEILVCQEHNKYELVSRANDFDQLDYVEHSQTLCREPSELFCPLGHRKMFECYQTWVLVGGRRVKRTLECSLFSFPSYLTCGHHIDYSQYGSHSSNFLQPPYFWSGLFKWIGGAIYAASSSLLSWLF